MTTRERPPFDADERTNLMGWYQLQRDVVLMKCEGISHEDAHRVVIPTSPLMTVAGLISHLRWTEHTWFEVAFTGTAPTGSPAFSQRTDDLDFMVADREMDQLLREYRRQCDRSDQVIAGAELDDLGAFDGFPAGHASLRWMIVHMIEETARHAGQLDVIRELLDGETGYF
ncbi:DinB family protein [Calidifontibacter terrae]